MLVGFERLLQGELLVVGDEGEDSVGARLLEERNFGANEALDLLLLEDLLRRGADLLEVLEARARRANARGEAMQGLVGGGDAMLARGAVEGLLLAAEVPEDAEALARAQPMLVAAIDIRGRVLAPGVGLAQNPQGPDGFATRRGTECARARWPGSLSQSVRRESRYAIEFWLIASLHCATYRKLTVPVSLRRLSQVRMCVASSVVFP